MHTGGSRSRRLIYSRATEGGTCDGGSGWVLQRWEIWSRTECWAHTNTRPRGGVTRAGCSEVEEWVVGWGTPLKPHTKPTLQSASLTQNWHTHTPYPEQRRTHTRSWVCIMYEWSVRSLSSWGTVFVICQVAELHLVAQSKHKCEQVLWEEQRWLASMWEWHKCRNFTRDICHALQFEPV